MHYIKSILKSTPNTEIIIITKADSMEGMTSIWAIMQSVDLLATTIVQVTNLPKQIENLLKIVKDKVVLFVHNTAVTITEFNKISELSRECFLVAGHSTDFNSEYNADLVVHSKSQSTPELMWSIFNNPIVPMTINYLDPNNLCKRSQAILVALYEVDDTFESIYSFSRLIFNLDNRERRGKVILTDTKLSTKLIVKRVMSNVLYTTIDGEIFILVYCNTHQPYVAQSIMSVLSYPIAFFNNLDDPIQVTLYSNNELTDVDEIVKGRGGHGTKHYGTFSL